MKNRKHAASVFLLLFAFSFPAFAQGKSTLDNLMPVPQKIERSNGIFVLDTSFTISIKGNPDARIYGAATRALQHLSGRTGIFFRQGFVTDTSKSDTAKLQIICIAPGRLGLHEDESYVLKISVDKIILSAPTDLGAIHGLQTLAQLLGVNENGYYFPACTIYDNPRFPWRGLMIDVARHFMPVNVIERNLDAMTFMKMNVLHLHLSDDQGFRVESKIYPNLAKMGSDGKYFTQSQVKEIIKYADDRGIRVIPEFDVPGHTQCWFVSHPELASGPGPYSIARTWGVHDYVLNPTIDATYKFLDKLFGEMGRLFPDQYFHIGGDENNGKQWKANKKIQAFMKSHNIKTTTALQTYFNNRLLKILTKHGKKMIGWDEILEPGMPNNIVIQSWRGQKALFKAARNGYMGILSNGYYIDLCQPASYHYLNDPIPPDSILSDDARKNILGGEATMWSELVTPENIDSRIWPRTAAIAERFWSSDTVRNVPDMYRRIDIINFELEDYGLTQIKNYDMMLRRMTMDHSIKALKVFTDVVEPVKLYARHRQGVHYTSYSPYTRVVDAARPESRTARYLSILVEEYINGKKSNGSQIDSLLIMWMNNNNDLVKTISISPILREIKPLSENLAAAAETGVEAMKFLENGETADKAWVETKTALLKSVMKPYGQVQLAIVPALEKLVNAAGGSR